MAVYPALWRVSECADALLEALGEFTEHLRRGKPWSTLSVSEPGRECFDSEAKSLANALADKRLCSLIIDNSFYGVSPLTDCLNDLRKPLMLLEEANHNDKLQPVFDAELYLAGGHYASLAPQDFLVSCLEDIAKHAFGFWGAVLFFELYGRKSGANLEANRNFQAAAEQYDFDRAFDDLIYIDEDICPPALDPDESVDSLEQFLPTIPQKKIMETLCGKALKKEDLARAVYGRMDQGNRLYRPGNLKELEDLGLVGMKRGVGYYRPDAPPPGTIKVVTFIPDRPNPDNPPPTDGPLF